VVDSVRSSVQEQPVEQPPMQDVFRGGSTNSCQSHFNRAGVARAAAMQSQAHTVAEFKVTD